MYVLYSFSLPNDCLAWYGSMLEFRLIRLWLSGIWHDTVLLVTGVKMFDKLIGEIIHQILPQLFNHFFIGLFFSLKYSTIDHLQV